MMYAKELEGGGFGLHRLVRVPTTTQRFVLRKIKLNVAVYPVRSEDGYLRGLCIKIIR